MKKYSNEEYKALLTEIENIDFAEVKLENECEERVCSDLNLWDGRNTKFGYGRGNLPARGEECDYNGSFFVSGLS